MSGGYLAHKNKQNHDSTILKSESCLLNSLYKNEVFH